MAMIYDWWQTLDVARRDVPFSSLIMAAALKADTKNLERLREVFPELVTEARTRYGAPCGLLPDELEHLGGLKAAIEWIEENRPSGG